MRIGKRQLGIGFAIAAVIVALAGGFYIGNGHVDAQGPGSGPGGPGRLGGPG